ncbi:MAG: type II toxin-antitoxin system VapC family toxin [Thermofilaceae archaeon]|nr:type II toxin-antitoxin system VapC family toxin [Thermofilaceae archaeon]MDW8003457.1 type II toxin-antitoxin system VapC family toxin [Thermofilaceae archaeon]
MKFLYDASALLNLLRELKADARSVLKGHYILSLTKYEVGNAVWKEACLRRRLSVEEAEELLRLLNVVYKLLDVVEPFDWDLVLKVACALEVTVYDSAYIVTSIERGFTLVTDDEKLRRKSESSSRHLKELLGREPLILCSEDVAKLR